VLSKCLELDACRYNGQVIRAPLVTQLLPFVDLVAVCPEVEIGLGVPRDPIRLVGQGDHLHLVQPSTQRDVTGEMIAFSDRFLGAVGAVDGFILKSRSPSCGINDATVHASATSPRSVRKSAGLFGRAVLEHFCHSAVEDEGRFTTFRRWHHFLTKLYVNARFRLTRVRGGASALAGFHADHQFLLMAYHQSATRALESIVANHDRHTTDTMFDRYADELHRALNRPARDSATNRVLTHVFGYVSPELSLAETTHFANLLAEFRAEHLDLSALLAPLRSWVDRLEPPLLAAQLFLQPYPASLLEQHDSSGA